ncbi:hypothetical protein IFM89_004559 [Coptis chinensis]|uniref:Syntaxin N-terminal domain-containing protein n=1 Tax=Coptis chinensis TaxID=261450 RepID=A0A835LEC3_9MAGN|nr:hypothetical protein IFM89_004559 [Coptis chinensis]
MLFGLGFFHVSSEEKLKEWTSLAEQRKHHCKCKVCEFQTILRKRKAELVEFKKEKDISKDIQSVDTSQQDEDSGGLKFLTDTCIEANNQEKNDNNDLEVGSFCNAIFNNADRRQGYIHIGRLVKDAATKLKQASETDQYTEVSVNKKIDDAKLAKDFQAVLKEFHKA